MMAQAGVRKTEICCVNCNGLVTAIYTSPQYDLAIRDRDLDSRLNSLKAEIAISICIVSAHDLN